MSKELSKEKVYKKVYGMEITSSQAMDDSMDMWAKQQAIKFAESLHPDEDGNHWVMYDAADQWLNLKTDQVLSTEELYNLKMKPE